MKEKDEIDRVNNFHDNIKQKSIEKIGLNRTLDQIKKNWKKESIQIIKSSYDMLRKDMRCYPFSGVKRNSEGMDLVRTIDENKNNLPIFEVEEDDIEYDIDFPIIPYKKFYIASNSCEIIDNEFYAFGGFFVMEWGKHLLVIYRWSRSINDGWAFCSFAASKNGLNKISTDLTQDVSELSLNHGEISKVAMKKFNKLMKKLIYKINKNDYGSYKIYSHGTYTENKISRDVRGHIRHFWRDSGKFILPTLSKDELLNRGYQIAELAIRDGTLRKDVPFKVISQFKIGEPKEEKNNRIYDLIEKRIWRCEETIFKILKEIFPTNIIRRHDRRTLKGLELDFNLPEFRLGIEYDGEQHFDEELYKKLYGEGFHAQVRRDRMKNVACRRKKIKLIRIKYNEPLTKTHIKKKLKEIGVPYV